MGYRHFDGALVYFNEHEVGQAIREKIADGTVRREDIFYCGKVCYLSWFKNAFCFCKACIEHCKPFPQSTNVSLHHVNSI